MTQERTPVLIVGAGGAGLSLSLLLHQQGIASMLVERRPDVSWVPRARNLNFRTLEVLRGLGLHEEVYAAGSRVTHSYLKETLASPEKKALYGLIIDSLFPPPQQELTPEIYLMYCPQNRLEPLLLAANKQRGCDVRYGTRFVSFTQDDAGVTASLEEIATGRAYEVRADYLVGSDGAHTRPDRFNLSVTDIRHPHIRELLGIGSQGYGAIPEYFIWAFFRAPVQPFFGGHEEDAFMIKNPDVEGFFIGGKGDFGAFLINYHPDRGETFEQYTPERCQSLLEKAIGQPGMPVEILDITHWQPAEDVAEQFQKGRVFLVGDAAHTMPAYKGLGLNTAVQSAQNLAWKLAAVMGGQAGPELLSTYQTERHPVGRFVAHQSLTGPGAAILAEGVKSALRPEEDLPMFYPVVGYRYRSQAVMTEDASSSEQEIALLDREELTGEPGSRVPHLWLEQGGQRISTLDLLDGRFVLLAGPAGTPWQKAATEVAGSLGIKLAAYRVGADGDLLDLENVWQTRMGVSAEGAMLVRPDGFVAWRTDTLPTNPETSLEQVLVTVLCRSTPATNL
ncbi:MAG: FAD-dependent monooxygenase [Chloroflexi bacterium]|nr:FAD-dependent monooxygenase [Chloroflexota bacterium]